ncbi:fumarylacetoacetase [Pseudogemmatithrix spongiicola]|uniref:fumarylacetoacetase n=1 Tax=Pseudogemmatithrix spongiicola TaxID=3062599 RepID=A0AA49Q6P7_9BACT|nr:fumarylacetoacetase [Gemmatimonadaceae bacterium 'strain 138']WKW16212.1 fumarylacetoacetase [Gemmatimonadaceae bacterium 'strain 318']
MTHDPTIDPNLRSWVEAANAGGTDFPIQNLPLGCFIVVDGQAARSGVAIGDRVLDLRAARDAGLFDGLRTDVLEALDAESLTPLFATGRTGLAALRRRVSELLASSFAQQGRVADVLVPMAAVRMTMPAEVGDYTDFYASIDHATNVGSMFRPDNPLLPNYKHVPIGYHGRASSLVVSGTAVKRPHGQTSAKPEGPPSWGASARLDYELEVGAFIAGGNALGHAIPLGEAEQHLAGLVLVNDWSARDVQTWEYQPLGPFLAKNFATTLSPWVVTLDALAPFRVPARTREATDPAPLPYLLDAANERAGGFGITLEVWLQTAKMREAGDAPVRLSQGDFTRMYWTMAQMLAHHASNGCNMRPGDLFASGTVSGPTKDSRGCLLELTWRGTEPLALPNGETRTFLADGDEVIMRGWCERPGAVRIGFGECRGVVLPAV